MMDTTRQDRVAREALAALPIRLRTPYVMRRMADASDRDISEALRVPPGHVARRLARAEERLQRSFEAEGVDPAAMHAALDTYLTIPPAADFVPRVMAAIRQLPPPTAAAPMPGSERARQRLDRMTMIIVAILLSSALICLARGAKSALTDAMAH